MLNQYFKELVTSCLLENRETCRHWIDYKIYDSLSEDLKKIYILQFPLPRFALSKSSGEDDFSFKVHCKASHVDSHDMGTCDCTPTYKKSMKKLYKKIKKFEYVQTR